MSVREYIGARYVPLFIGDWDNTKTYEPLSIVQYQGNSYTSRQYVPTGIEITNETYWALTGNFNSQLENIINQVNDLSDSIKTQLIKYEDIEKMCASEFNDWEYCIVIDGFSDDFCNTHKETIYKRIKPGDYEYTFDGLYVLNNNDKALPCEDFNNCNNDFEEHLFAICDMMCNKAYSYENGRGVFTNPFLNGEKVGQCTTLSYMYMLGLTPNNSRYFRGANATNVIPPIAFKHKKNIQDWEGYQDDYAWAKYSAMEALASGYGFKPVNLNEIHIGDILYTGPLTDEETTVLLNAEHAEIVTGIDYNTETFVVWEWGSMSNNVIKTGQGSNNSPSIAIKDWNVVKNSIKIVCRLPLQSVAKPVKIFELGETQTRHLGSYTGSSYIHNPIFASSITGHNGNSGLIKIEIDIDPVDNPVRFGLTGNADSINGTYIGLSPLTYGGKTVFYAPIVDTNMFSCIAISQNRIEMDITIKSIEVSVITDNPVFDIRPNSIISTLTYPAQAGKTIETTIKGTINDGKFIVQYEVSNIDWSQITTSTAIFELGQFGRRYPAGTYTVNVWERNTTVHYKGNYQWALDTVPTSNDIALRITAEFPITCGAIYWSFATN